MIEVSMIVHCCNKVKSVLVHFGFAKAFNPFAYVNASNHLTFVHISTEGHDSLQ